MKTDAGKTESRDLPPSPQRDQPKQTHPHQAFDVGRLDNEVEPPKMLLDVIHAGVAIWGLLLAAGVFFFGGRNWQESLLVLGVFVFFVGAWRIAMILGARRKKSREVDGTESDSPQTSVRAKSSRRPGETCPVDPTAETRPLDRSAESTAAEREYISRSP